MRVSKLLLVAWLASPAAAEPPTCAVAKLTVRSPAFPAHGEIPSEYTCDGREISPPLVWSGVPRGTRSIVILVEDATTAAFTHWIVTGLGATTSSLAGGTALPRGAIAGKNDLRKAGWTGPCPARGRHHYTFRVFALDVPLGKQVTSQSLPAALNGHVIATGELVGTYQRQAQTLVMR
ncbi:MAG: hypothetical protein H6Q90_1860 [Deltaproteobacteria bacterium]|nr:hypothetical protein [Deltaproteobacteria bacterium]